MNIGMLWFDESPGPLSERVQRAADFYAEKYGVKPTLCMVNPAMLESSNGNLNGIRLQGARAVMPDHFWIGVDESNHKSRTENGKEKAKTTRARSVAKRPTVRKQAAAKRAS